MAAFPRSAPSSKEESRVGQVRLSRERLCTVIKKGLAAFPRLAPRSSAECPQGPARLLRVKLGTVIKKILPRCRAALSQVPWQTTRHADNNATDGRSYRDPIPSYRARRQSLELKGREPAGACTYIKTQTAYNYQEKLSEVTGCATRGQIGPRAYCKGTHGEIVRTDEAYWDLGGPTGLAERNHAVERGPADCRAGGELPWTKTEQAGGVKCVAGGPTTPHVERSYRRA
ncbi:hypothetical protein PoB_000015500 [Plakobranchus ocellatus]|uniref:Uncharacterized protein n=1 Tax=Plakobranchus ocellatus TaxID=259542 RepID=A0AAV3XRB9_9GAST|nr:hypothetical protein PoB_000015500 [Plakobranchus ocellatus]